MPQLAGQNIVELTLPSSSPEDPAIVELNTGIGIGLLAGIDEAQDNMTKSLTILSKAIVGWNFTDKDGNAVPVTLDTVKQLSVPDFTFLIKHLDYGKLTEDQEKKIDSVPSEPIAEPDPASIPAA